MKNRILTLLLVGVACAATLPVPAPAVEPPALVPVKPSTAPATAPAAAHVIFNSQSNRESLREPLLRPLTWAHVAMYADNPIRRSGPLKGTMLKIPHENIRAFARLCRDGGVVNNAWIKGVPIVAGAPVVLDWEGAYAEDNLHIFAEYVRVFKAEAPGLKVSVNSVNFWHTFLLETWRDGLTAEQVAKLDKGMALTKPITDQCDFITSGAYLSAPEAIDRDLAAYRACCDLLKVKYPGKALYVFVNPNWCYAKSDTWKESDGWGNRVDYRRLSPEAARKVLDLTARYDGTVLWSGKWEGIKEVFLPLIKEDARRR